MNMKRTDLTAYQHLGEGERFATRDDNLSEDAQVANIYGIGCEYHIYQLAPEGYLVTMIPFGPAGLRAVVQREGVTWAQAMDHVRDVTVQELEDELNG
jgi:hypothetical protein